MSKPRRRKNNKQETIVLTMGNAANLTLIAPNRKTARVLKKQGEKFMTIKELL